MLYKSKSTFIAFLSVAADAVTTISASSSLHDHRHRTVQQQDADCGQIIGTITSEEVRAVGRSFLLQFIANDNDLVQRSSDVIFKPATLSMNIVKLCASCRDHADWYYERNSLVFPGYHSIYCNDNDLITYDARVSAIALVPIMADIPTQNSLPLNVKLRTFLTMPPTQINENGSIVASSERFVSQWTSGKSNNYTYPTGTEFFSTFLPGMMAASAGAIALFPDYLNSDNVNIGRSIFQQRSYEHATAVSYLALERYVMDASQQCTLLDKAVTIYGNDIDAAFGASVATLVLQRFGVACLGTFLSTGVLDVPRMLQDAIRDSSTTTTTVAVASPAEVYKNRWIQLAAHTIATKDRKFDSDVSWISDKYRDTLRQTFDPSNSSTTESVSVLSTTNFPINASDLFHPRVVEALRMYNSTDWDINEKDMNCTRFDTVSTGSGSVVIAADNNSTLYEKIICQLRAKYSVYKTLLSQTDRPWISNITACYSNMDKIVNGTHQYEYDTVVQNVKFVEEYWKRYTQPTGFDLLNITNQDHARAVQLCTVAPLLFLSLDGHRPMNVQEQGNFATPMTSEESLQCSNTATSGGTDGPPPSSSGGGGDGTIPAPSPVNPTIVAQPTQPDDSNPTIVSSPTSVSPGDSNPTIVARPTDTTPTNDIDFEGAPTSKESDESDDNDNETNSKSNGALTHSKHLSSFHIFAFLMVILLSTMM